MTTALEPLNSCEAEGLVLLLLLQLPLAPTDMGQINVIQ